MLSHPTSAIETRRRTHRRQNSTPNIEVGQFKKNPAPITGIQRANSHRGHRRGLSLDQHQSFQRPSRLTPTLGPITQDDLMVSTNTNAGHLQYRSTAVAHQGLAQPGHQNHLYSQPLSLETQGFSIESHHQFDQTPPLHNSPFPPYAFPQHHHQNSIPQSPLTPGHQPGGPPTQQQLEDLENHIKSVYGGYGDVYINVLPTPVATPQKRASIAPLDNVDVSPIPFTFDPSEVHLDPALVSQDFEITQSSPMGSPERGYESSFYSSPTHSNSCSPQQTSVKSFVNELSSPQFAIDENVIYSSQTTLADVEPLLPTSGSASPNRSISIADIRLDGTIEDTGISAEEVQQFISQQDPATHRWTCLYPGCSSKTFGRRENIRSHVQTHLGDRQYRCNHCNKCFVRQHDLKRHSKIHSGSKPYQCPCGGGFARQDALTRHRQRGMCVGGFPNAVRKQARRGRPRKHRPDMEERLMKAARTRDRAYSASSGSGDSGADDCPSPPAMPDICAIDAARLVDLQEDEIQNFSMDPSSFEAQSSPASHESYSSPFDLDADSNIYDLSTEVFAETPPASPPHIVDLANMANSPHDSITSPGLPATPPRGSSSAPASTSSSMGGYHTTPPTSPLCRGASPPPSQDICTSSNIFDELGISTSDQSSGSNGSDPMGLGLGMGMSFAGNDPTLATFSGLEYLKSGEDLCGMSFHHEPEDDGFRMWVMEGGEL